MTIPSDTPQAWPEAIVDIGPIEISAGYWGLVGLIPYDGHVVLAVIPHGNADQQARWRPSGTEVGIS